MPFASSEGALEPQAGNLLGFSSALGNIFIPWEHKTDRDTTGNGQGEIFHRNGFDPLLLVFSLARVHTNISEYMWPTPRHRIPAPRYLLSSPRMKSYSSNHRAFSSPSRGTKSMTSSSLTANTESLVRYRSRLSNTCVVSVLCPSADTMKWI